MGERGKKVTGITRANGNYITFIVPAEIADGLEYICKRDCKNRSVLIRDVLLGFVRGYASGTGAKPASPIGRSVRRRKCAKRGGGSKGAADAGRMHISFLSPPEITEGLERICERDCKSRSDLIRDVLLRYIRNDEDGSVGTSWQGDEGREL